MQILRWVATFLFPIPIAMFMTWCCAKVIGADGLGNIISELFHLYAIIGLYGVPYIFAWSSQTLFILLGGPHYSVMVNILYSFLIKKRRQVASTEHRGMAIFRWFLILSMPLPITLVLLRVILPIIPNAWTSGTGDDAELSFELVYARLVISLGIPYAAISLILRHLLRVDAVVSKKSNEPISL